MSLRRILWFGALAIALLAFFAVSVPFVRILALIARGAVDTDNLAYFVVARGILNGLTPYVDLFEAKPPGILLLSMLSLLVTGGQQLLSMGGVFALIAIPGLLAWVGFRTARTAGRPTVEQWTVAVAAGVAGTLLTLYVDSRARGPQTELFGTVALCLYATAALLWRERVTPRRSGLLALALLASIGSKEPFAIAALAVALLISRSAGEFLRVFVIPVALAALLGGLFLLATGWLRPYVSVYLPAMRFRIQSGDAYEPVWARGLSIRRLIYDLTVASPRFTGLLLATAWAIFPLTRGEDRRWVTVLAVLVGSFAAIAVIKFGYVLIIIEQLTENGLRAKAVLTQSAPRGMTIALLFFLPAAILQWRRGVLLRTVVACVVLCLAALAVGISTYSINHFAFAAPISFAVLLLVTVACARGVLPSLLTGALLILTAVAAFTYRPDEQYMAYMRTALTYTAAAQAPMAERLDGLLTACALDRYAANSVINDFGYARHSPVGPLFVRGFYNYIPEDHPLKTQTSDNIRKGDALLVLRSGEEDEEPFRSAMAKVTDVPPPCAEGFLPISGYRVYFPKSEGPG